MPYEMPRRAYEAWEIWRELDGYGRNIDTMGGFPLPIKLECLESLCARSSDSEYIKNLVQFIEEKALESRRSQYKKTHKVGK